MTDEQFEEFMKAMENRSDQREAVAKMVSRHEQTLYGINGVNGLTGEVKMVKADIKHLDASITKVGAVIVAIQVIFGAIATAASIIW